MDKDTAIELNRRVRQASGLLDHAAAVAQDELSTREFEAFRRQIGLILGEIYFSILEDLWEQFPDLLPDSMRDEE